MKKNFREVIRDIREGEVWESAEKRIECIRGDILISYKTNYSSDTMGFVQDVQYTLKPTLEPVSFDEVLNSGNKKCKVEHRLMDELYDDFDEFLIFDALLGKLYRAFDGEEIKDIMKNGKWYLEV